MRHERVKVTRDTLTVHSLTVAPWEIPILEYTFDDGNVVRTGEYVEIERDYPDPGQEFQRLQKAYGQDMKTETPYAVIVFGAARQGVKALAALIDAERDAEGSTKPKKRRRSIITDELLH